MTDQELVEKLNFHLNEVNEMLSLGDLGLLKSEELHGTKNKIEDALNSYKPFFGRIEALKIEKAIPQYRNVPKTGMFLNSGQVNPILKDLHVLLQELINVKGGSEQIAPVSVPQLKITGSTINQAIEDAKTLLNTQGATSALDRAHTVLHGYLRRVSDEASIAYLEEDTLNQLLNSLKKRHAALASTDTNTDQILKSMGNILDKLNPIRNSSSLAHANTTLLNPEEAMLVINTVNTLLSYLDSKFSK